MALFELSNVYFAYNRSPVLESCDAEIEAGAFIGIIGPNGAGKSTLLHLMSGVLRPQRGRVLYRGRPVADYPRRHIAQEIAMVPQLSDSVFPFRVREIVLMGRHPYLSALAFEGKRDFEIVDRVMDITGTQQLADKRFNELSGGERQLVLIARALAQQPEVLLLDEPTASLDLHHQRAILQIVNRLNRQEKRTVILVSHDINVAALYCKEIAVLHGHKIFSRGRPEELLKRELLESLYGQAVEILKRADGLPLVTLRREDTP
ncbi:MAG: ABC transporter ATP-binding protein [bacterium]